MEDADTRWREVRRELALNEDLVAIERRLLEVEERLDGIRRQRGLSEGALAEIADRHDEGAYLSVVERDVSALGGRLELRAVFDADVVSLPLAP